MALASRSAAHAVGSVGRRAEATPGAVGRMTFFLAHGLRSLLSSPRRGRALVRQMRFIGNRSLAIIALSAAFTGMVLVLQGYETLSRFGSEQQLGALVSISLVRELGPVLGALMVTARAGSAIAATLANMRVTEQIDALRSLGIDPMSFLVAPRLGAGLLTVPMLVALYCLVGIGAAGALAAGALNLDAARFLASVHEAVTRDDVIVCLSKSVLFALILVWVATYRGFHASGGARGVGVATTRAVVEAAVLILVGDYVATGLGFRS